MRLQGRVALISCGARGMGAEEARLFAQEGAKVVIGDVLDEEGSKNEAEINETGGEALFVRLDVTREEQWRQAVESALTRFGKLDILVNNAGVGGLRSGGQPMLIEDAPVEDWDRVMEVNAKGVFLGTKHVIAAMRDAGGGSIVNISSMAGIVALPGSSGSGAYEASKGAVRLLTKATAIQYSSDGIRCNSVHPGWIDTPMTEFAMEDPDRRAQWVEYTPLGRIGVPRDIANGVLFLASDESSFMTGSELVIDGGVTAQ